MTSEGSQQLEEQFRELIDRLPEAVLIHRQGNTVYANQNANELLGYGPDGSLVGVPVLSFIHPDDHALVMERVRQGMMGVRLPVVTERLVRRDGTILDVDVVSMPVVFEGQRATLVLGRDVTERRKMEAKLLTIDRLASTGRLAAAVSHEVNNPLAYILGSLELLRREVRKIAPCVETSQMQAMQSSLEIALEGVSRIRDIVADLLSLSRSDIELLGPVDMQRVIDLSVRMASHEVGQRARLMVHVQDVPTVYGNEARLAQVFLNLLLNAAQACPPSQLYQNVIRVQLDQDDQHVVVDVHDPGTGVTPDLRSRIFEPFFTTRGTGGGLGLPICREIVESFGGSIEVVHSEQGSTFRVRLLPSQPSQRNSVLVGQPHDQAYKARILVADDEPQILKVIADMLSTHEVVTVRNGSDALVHVVQGPPFDVVLLDLRMPALSGMDVYLQLVRQGAVEAQRVIFMTGGEISDIDRDVLVNMPGRCLEKPFRYSTLMARVASVLDSAAS